MAVSRITHEVVQQADWAMSTYGPMRSLARDVRPDLTQRARIQVLRHMGKLWLCSERHAFEIACESEERASAPEKATFPQPTRLELPSYLL